MNEGMTPGTPPPETSVSGVTEPEKKGEEATTGLTAEEFSSLAERFSAVAPLLRGLIPAKEPETATAVPALAKKDAPRKKGSPREALLCALKPYLSPERREMADYLLRVCRVYDTLQGLF